MHLSTVTSVRSLAMAICLTACLSAPVSFAQDAFKLQDQTVMIGDTDVMVPVIIDNSEARHGASLSISWENDKLELTGVEKDSATNSALWFAGLIRQDQGEMVWSIVMGFNSGDETFDDSLVIPAGDDVVIASLVFDVLATEETTATIQFEDDLSSWATGDPQVLTKNRLTTAGVPTSPDITTNGTATITINDDEPPPGGIFRRGDTDGNGTLDVTDPINNLSFQFLGTFTPPCRDAADFDDNGKIEVTDPIGNLSHQFLGQAPPPAPGKDDCGEDPTDDDANGNGTPGDPDDDLGCEQYPAANAPPSAACDA